MTKLNVLHHIIIFFFPFSFDLVQNSMYQGKYELFVRHLHYKDINIRFFNVFNSFKILIIVMRHCKIQCTFDCHCVLRINEEKKLCQTPNLRLKKSVTDADFWWCGWFVFKMRLWCLSWQKSFNGPFWVQWNQTDKFHKNIAPIL